MPAYFTGDVYQRQTVLNFRNLESNEQTRSVLRCVDCFGFIFILHDRDARGWGMGAMPASEGRRVASTYTPQDKDKRGAQHQAFRPEDCCAHTARRIAEGMVMELAKWGSRDGQMGEARVGWTPFAMRGDPLFEGARRDSHISVLRALGPVYFPNFSEITKITQLSALGSAPRPCPCPPFAPEGPARSWVELRKQ